jgi:hypothetical protein
MALSNQTSSVTFDGDGVTTVFAYAFRIPENADAVVSTFTEATGDTVTLTEGVDYSITGINSDDGGNVTLLGDPLADGQTITIRRRVPLVQGMTLNNEQGFLPSTLMSQLDKIVMMSQQQAADIDRSVKVPVGSSQNSETLVTDLLNSAATAIAAAASTAGSEAAAEASATAAAGSATAAATSETAAATSETNAAASATAAAASAASIAGDAAAAAASATAAAASASAAATSETNAASSASSAGGSLAEFLDKYLGAHATAPTTETSGDPLTEGDLYLDSTSGAMKVWHSGAWTAAYVPDGSYLTAINNLSELSSPADARTNLGLGNVDNTSDISKPISTAVQSALDTKADTTEALDQLITLLSTLEEDDIIQVIGGVLSAQSMSGLKTALALTAGDVGLGNVDNTADEDKPISTAVQTALDAKSIKNRPEAFLLAISDETTAITTGTAKLTFRLPYAFTVTAVKASLSAASSSGNPTFDINQNGTSILGTKLSIDSGEKTSVTAASAATIAIASLASDDEITIDIDTAGTGATGAKITIIGYQT